MSDTSLTCVTVGVPIQLSASSVISVGSAGGIGSPRTIEVSAGGVPVGGMLSLIETVCVQSAVFPAQSV